MNPIFQTAACGADFIASCRDNWRWAWKTVQPQIHGHDIDLVRQHLVDFLASTVRESGDRAGVDYGHGRTVMGFCGKALEAAEFLLAEARLDDTVHGAELRRKAEKNNRFLSAFENGPSRVGGIQYHER